jgi:hypothetical protein
VAITNCTPRAGFAASKRNFGVAMIRNGTDFGRWTTDEVQDLTESTAKIGASHCPVCGTPIDWQAAPGELLLRCVRCGNSNQWQNL